MLAQRNDGGVQVIRVFLVDDHELVLRGVKELVSAEADMEVVGQAGSAATALAGIGEAKPDVAVLDISLGDGSGIEVCRAVTAEHETVACLMLTSVLDERALIEAEAAGAAGFCLKSIGSNDLIESIRKVAGGARLLDPVEVRSARRHLQERGEAVVDDLTPQETKIFELIGKGYSNRQIADEMYIAEKTVKNYVSNMFAKLGVERRTQAAALAARLSEREAEWK